VLIDGRIIPVVASGFVSDIIAIPRSVLGELQFLADNADAEKRARARHGLDIVKELQGIEGADVQIFQDGSKAEEGVDERLLKLAKKYAGAICTIDYNLNKVAIVEGITVLNVNELAKNLRMAYLPGEKLKIELVQKGQDNHQAVGYLPDGTMVVVEHASSQIGQFVEVEFIRSLQTAAGKMMFAKKVDAGVKPTSTQPKPVQKPQGTKPVRQNQNRNSRSQASMPETTPVVSSPAPAVVAAVNPPKPNRPSNNPRPNQNNSRRPQQRRSSDREASLIDLVDKQN
jgi:rRNA-processing protein FCF1